MIGIDTNLLVYAHRRESRFHDRCAEIVRDLAQGAGTWAIPWPCLYEFFSIVTNPRIWKDKTTPPDRATDQIAAWVASPSVTLLRETDGFYATLRGFVDRPRVRGPIVHDARIAALCYVHGINELWSADRDFALFPELNTHNPLETFSAADRR